MGKSSPKAPDPKETAAAQTSTNIGSAIANNTMGNVSQVTPYGNLDYSVTGYDTWTDPNNGEVYQLPKYTATQTLSENGEQVLAAQNQSDLNLAQLAAEQSGRLGGLLSQPLNLSNEATEARLAELGHARLDPALAQRRTAKETQLANQGIMPGSAAYDRAMNTLNEGENDAYNQLYLTGRQQAVQEAITERQQPINEIIGIANGTQLQNPSYAATNQAQIGTPDVAGLIMQNYQNELAAWQQKQNMLGGLFGTIAGGIAASDRRIKKDLVKFGDLGGIGVYKFRYIFEPDNAPHRTGFIAQEVQEVLPQAVHEDNGLLSVDYDMVEAWAKENSINLEAAA